MLNSEKCNPMAQVTKKMAKMTKIGSAVIGGFPALKTTALTRDLHVIAAGHAAMKHEWIHHRFSLWGVAFVVSGRGTYRVDDGPEMPVGPGSIFAVWPGPIFHYGATDGQTPPPNKPNGVSPTAWNEYHVCLEGPGLKRLLRSGVAWQTPRVFQEAQVHEHVERWRELLAVFRRRGPGDGERASLLAERLLLELFYSRVDGRTARPPSPAIQSVIAHCKEHFASNIDWHALARRHAMSYSLLRLRVREATGQPPARFAMQLRCDAARALLGETDWPVKEIAARVGFDDPYEFSRMFTRSVGTSPRNYRRQTKPWQMG